MKIGDKIRYLRVKNEWTQKELAEKLGIKQNTLSDYERNISSISLNLTEKLVSIFDVEPAYFLEDDEPIAINKNKAGRLIVEDLLDSLIKRKIITDPHNIDKTTMDMLVQVMRKDIENKLKEQS